MCIRDRESTESQLEIQDVAAVINRFLESLSVQQRTIFMRRYWHMTSIGDIAKAYGLSLIHISPTVLGRNTVEQIQVGVVGGYVGNMEYLIRRTLEEMHCDNIKVIATGGLSRMIAEQTDHIDIVDTSLTMAGLQMIYDRNRDAKPVAVTNR